MIVTQAVILRTHDVQIVIDVVSDQPIRGIQISPEGHHHIVQRFSFCQGAFGRDAVDIRCRCGNFETIGAHNTIAAPQFLSFAVGKNPPELH